MEVLFRLVSKGSSFSELLPELIHFILQLLRQVWIEYIHETFDIFHSFVLPNNYIEAFNRFNSIPDLFKDGVTYYHIGRCYYEEKGVNKDKLKAKECFRIAHEKFLNSRATNRHPIDYYCLGRLYDMENNYITSNKEEAFRYYKQGADLGFKIAQLNLGVLYQKGEGTQRDYKKAMKLYEKAAKQGNALGYYNIATLYFFGGGVERDNEMSKKYFQISADLGYSIAHDKIISLFQ